MDINSTVWNFKSWGRPFQLISPLLDCSSPETTPIQIECSWTFSAVLTRSGDVYVSFEGAVGHQYQETIAELDKDKSTSVIVPIGGVIPCYTWEMNVDPIKLPALPDLPDLLVTGLSEKGHRKETKLIKIASLSCCIIGLTNKGHVLKMDGLYKEDHPQAWDYVSGNA